MTIITTSLKHLNKLVGKELTMQDLHNALYDLGMDLKSNDPNNLDVELTADRPDLIPLHGLARALKYFLELETKMPTWKVKDSNYQVKVEDSVSKIRPHVVAALIKNLTLNNEDIKEIIQVQEKLNQTIGRSRKKVAIGIYPSHKIKFPVTYLAKNPKDIEFIPLGLTTKKTAEDILEEHPTGQKFANLLNNFKQYPIFEDSNNEVLSMPPIINSETLGRVDTETKEVFIECTGSDLNTLNNVLNILVTMFQDMGGKIYSVKVNNKTTPNLDPFESEFSISNCNKLIGLNLDEKQITTLLQRMMYKVKSINKDKVTLEIPKIRTDIWHEVDLIDDVARAYGFNNITPTFPNISTIGATLPLSDLKEKLSQILLGLGFTEVHTDALTSKEDQYEKMQIKEGEHIQIPESIEKEINMIRTNLFPETIKVFHYNRSSNFPQKVFECNFCIIPDEKQDVKAKNILKLSCAVSNTTVSFTEVRQALDSTLEAFGLETKIKEQTHNSFIKGRFGKILIDKKQIGLIGELHPQVLTNWELVNPIALFEINVDTLLELIK